MDTKVRPQSIIRHQGTSGMDTNTVTGVMDQPAGEIFIPILGWQPSYATITQKTVLWRTPMLPKWGQLDGRGVCVKRRRRIRILRFGSYSQRRLMTTPLSDCFCVKQMRFADADEFEEFIHEAIMLRLLTNWYDKQSRPLHVVRGFGLVAGQKRPQDLRLVMEWLPPDTIASYYQHWRSSSFTDQDHRICWVLLWLTLLELYASLKFHHGDLHMENIMFQWLPQWTWFAVCINGTIFRVRSRYRLILIDLQFASAIGQLDGMPIMLYGPSLNDLEATEQNVYTDLFRFMTNCWDNLTNIKHSVLQQRKHLIADCWAGICLTTGFSFESANLPSPGWCQTNSPGTNHMDGFRHLYHPELAHHILTNTKLDDTALNVVRSLLHPFVNGCQVSDRIPATRQVTICTNASINKAMKVANLPLPSGGCKRKYSHVE
jgi:hypothetical protein